MTPILFIVGGIILVNGLLSTMETAFFSVPLIRVKMWSETGWRGKILFDLKQKSEIPLVTLLTLSNITTVVGSMWVGSLVVRVYGSEWIGLASGVLTFVIVIFSEIIPKKLGDHFSHVIALNGAVVLWFVSFLFRPFAWLIDKVLSPFKSETELKITSEEEIAFLAELAGREGLIESDESDLIKKAFVLNDVTAGEIMTRLDDLSFLPGDSSLIDKQRLILNSRQSYFPVVGDNFRPIGIVRRSFLMTALLKGYRQLAARDLCHEPFLVGENERADHLLEILRSSSDGLALVVCGSGSLLGVVELETILEQLVGEIV